jgi:regulator of protease activity HflC (stomatin/prohibitin superfamily)
MVTVFLILIAIGIMIFPIIKAVNNKDSKQFTKLLVIGIGMLVISLFQPYSLERVDAGYKGIKVKLTGNNRGVADYEYKTGWVVYNSYTEQMLEFPTYQLHVEYPEQQVITKGGFSAIIKPTFNYSLKENNIGNMFENLRKPIDEVEQGWLQTAIVGAVMDVANKWKIDDVFNKREQFEAAIALECNKRIAKWFTVSQLRTNITPPPSLQAAIESETKAIKEAQAKEQQALVAIANGKKMVAQAQADSAKRVITASGKARAMLIEAEAEAKSIKLKQSEISNAYNDYIRANRWDGKLPTTILGSSSGTLVNIK